MLLAEGGMRAYKPRYFKAHQHRHGLDDLARLARRLSAGYVLAALVYGGAGAIALEWLAPARYAPLVRLLPPIAMGFAFMGIMLLNMCPYNCERRVSRLTALVVACALAKLALGVPLIQRFGVDGASAAMMLGFACTAVVCWIARPEISPPRPHAGGAPEAQPAEAPA
jgi:O-antigen/teichoic acid export membrane protein